MKKNNKGVSLVSLVIIIVVTVILISVVVTVGYNYIQESNRIKELAVVKFISDAAKEIQNSSHVDDQNTHYVGYVVDTNNLEGIKGLPEDFTVETEDMWYFIDSNSAEELGVQDANRYIERDLRNPQSEKVKTVMVDYFSGEAYLVEITVADNPPLADRIVIFTNCTKSPSGEHQWSIQNCTKGSSCVNCGEENPGHGQSLGHDYAAPTCTKAATCRRCFEIDLTQPAKGHTFDVDSVTGKEIWTTDATRHWKECIECQARKETDEHKKGSVKIRIEDDTRDDPEYHKEVCSVCGWESVKTPHEMNYEIVDEKMHKAYCDSCGYSEEHTDTGWITTDDRYHWKECEEGCPSPDGEKLFYGEHEDKNGDCICDICSKVMDTTPPDAFKHGDVNILEITTSKIKLSAYTEDDVGVKGYKFAIDTGEGIDWEQVELIETEENERGEKTFENLQANTAYNMYVVATDFGGNETPQYQIPNTVTARVPDVEITGIPETYSAEQFTVTFKTIPENTFPTISIEYSTNEGTNWTTGSSTVIDKETVEVWARAKDTRLPEPNKGEITRVTITNYDKTPPTVTITPKTGDDPAVLKTSHTAVVAVRDDKAQIEPNTVIKYAWSTSNTVVPTDFVETHTTNSTKASNTSIDITTPAGGVGEYYLWIDKGIQDALGNVTTEAVCSTVRYMIDDEDVVLSNIRMYNPTPDIASYPNFVKKNGTITVTFASQKALGEAPSVVVGGVAATTVTSLDNFNWTATMLATDVMPEGALSLTISDLKTISGKISNKEYTEINITGNRLVYDKTLPTLEYIEK